MKLVPFLQHTRAIPKVSSLDILDNNISTVYTSVKRTSFTDCCEYDVVIYNVRALNRSDF